MGNGSVLMGTDCLNISFPGFLCLHYYMGDTAWNIKPYTTEKQIQITNNIKKHIDNAYTRKKNRKAHVHTNEFPLFRNQRPIYIAVYHKILV